MASNLIISLFSYPADFITTATARNDRRQLHKYTNKACIVPHNSLIFTNRMITLK